jgi:uncharacterized membrane protein YsdA (DUF1294 family)
MISETYFDVAVAVLALVNLASFVMFRGDKLRSKRNDWRTSEGKLLLAAFFGPYGAFLAMRRYRHKTKHAKFLLVPLFVILQTGLIVFLVLRYGVPFLTW